MNRTKLMNVSRPVAALLALLGAVASPAIASESGVSASTTGPAEVIEGAGTGGTACYYEYYIRTDGTPRAAVGDELTYQIHLANTGACDLRHIHVSDILPKGTMLVSATPAATATEGDHLIWDGLTMKKGEKQVFEIKVRTVASAQQDVPGYWVTNTGCAYTPWIGTRICDSASSWIVTGGIAH